MKRLICLTISSIMLLSILPLFSVRGLHADSIWIAPSTLSFSSNNTSVGQKLNITIWLNMSTPTNSWQFYLIYNKSQLNATRCDYTGNGQSQWSGSMPANTVTPSSGMHNSTYNYVLHGEALKNGAVKTAAGSLSWVEFQIIQAPAKGMTLQSDLRLDIVGVFNTQIMDADFNILPVSFGKSTYTFASPWTPPPPASINVDPSKIADPLLTPCSNFTVNVIISEAANVYTFAFKLGFDRNILKAWETHSGSFFPPSAVVSVIIDNASGFVQFSAHLVALPTVGGNGTLATIKFHVEGLGPSILHLYDVEIQDDLSRTLPSNSGDGHFNNVLLAKLYVDPLEIIDPTLVPPKTFDVNVTLNNVENLYGYKFNMSFNKNALTCLYLMVHDVMGETNYIPETQISNAEGFAWVKATYFSPAVPITTYNPVALVTMHFRVKSPGISILDLHDTSLTNSTGGAIPHEVSDGFVETLIRDVAVAGVAPLSSWTYAGWPVRIMVITKNLGNVSENFNVTVYANTTFVGMLPLVGLAPNVQTTLNFTWDTTGLPGGKYVISANASILPFEMNTANNRFVDGNVNILTVKHDVAVTYVAADVPWAYQGWLVKINVTAANLGGYIETFNVTMFYDSTLIGMAQIANLDANTSVKLTFAWHTAGVTPCHNYTIRAEATAVPFEYNATNNTFIGGKVKIRIVGDVDGDGKVDITDLALASAAFGSRPGHPKWNPACDINRDNRIDIFDIARVTANFAKTCPHSLSLDTSAELLLRDLFERFHFTSAVKSVGQR